VNCHIFNLALDLLSIIQDQNNIDIMGIGIQDSRGTFRTDRNQRIVFSLFYFSVKTYAEGNRLSI
jgi:hypothetical protein